MASNFFTRHPFYKNLLKFSAYIVVGYNALVFSMLVPLLILIIVGVALSGAAPTAGTGASALADLEPVAGSGAKQLLSIKITGVIVGDEDDGAGPFGALDGYVSGYKIKEQLYEAAADSAIHGIILEINSPGGTIYGAHAIADGVKYYREETKQPVYAHISGVGASGAYWSAVAADKVLADYGSSVGSIGVIMGPFEYYDKVLSQDGGIFGGGVLTQNGIEHITITAGKSKDVGNPYRRMTAAEIAMLQGQINNDYDLFVNYVSERRSLTPQVIREQVGAMIYDTKSAQSLKLIDATASREDAYEQLADAAKVTDDFVVMRAYRESGFFQAMLGAVGIGEPRKVESTQATAARAQATGCALSSSVMAYYGSPATLCPVN